MFKNRQKTGFEDFLRSRAGLENRQKTGKRRKTRTKTNKIAFEQRPSLNFVLEKYLKDTKDTNNKPAYPNDKTKKWQQKAGKELIRLSLASSIKLEHHKRKKRLAEHKLLSKKIKTEGFGPNAWVLALVGATVLALFLSISLVYFAPKQAERFSRDMDKLYLLPIVMASQNSKLADYYFNKLTEKDPTYITLSKDMKLEYLERNKKMLQKQHLEGMDIIQVKSADIWGQVAGASESSRQAKINSLKLGSQKFVDDIVVFYRKLVNLQIKISYKLNDKLINFVNNY